MSSNRTVIPGMESSYGNGQNDQFSSPVHDQGKTYVPGGAVSPSGESNYTSAPQKPIVGFLYSISRTNAGEFWPLHIGTNTIGRSPNCDICLAEKTVSDNHATLVVRMMKNPEKVIASLCDSSSTIGTMVNGESLGFDQRECFNGDVFTVGAHYDLLFILIDPKQIGLKVNPEFIPAATMPVNNVTPPPINQQGAAPTLDYSQNNPYMPPANVPRRTQAYDNSTPVAPGATQPFGSGSQAEDPGNGPVQGGNSGGRTIFM